MFDPTDSCYKISEQFSPDKESTWTYPPSCDGWVHAHNALRGEMSMMRIALEAIEERGCDSLKEWERKSLALAATAHFEHIHGHHSNEDDVFSPEMRKRFQFPDKLEADHVGLVEKLKVLESLVNNLKEGDPMDKIVELRQHWVDYESMVRGHLAEEEEIGLPLMRAYFTAKDVAPITQKIISRCSRNEIGSFVYFMGQKRCREEFMKQEGIPWFVWYLDFKGKLGSFEKNFVTHVVALTEGKEPKAKTGRFLNLL